VFPFRGGRHVMWRARGGTSWRARAATSVSSASRDATPMSDLVGSAPRKGPPDAASRLACRLLWLGAMSRAFIVALLVGSLASACQAPGPPAQPVEQVAFFWSDGDEAVGGQAIASHSDAGIWFQDLDSPDVASLRSSDPSVASLSPSDARIPLHLNAGHAGHATLEAFDDSGRRIGTTGVDVEDIAGIQPRLGLPGLTPIVLANTPIALYVDVVAADGAALVYRGAVSVVPSSNLTRMPFDGNDVAGIRFSGPAGSGYIDISAAGHSLRQPLSFVDATAIVRLTPKLMKVDGDLFISVTAESAEGPVYGAACDWKLDNLTSTPVAPYLSLSYLPEDSLLVTVQQPGPATATCTIGTLSTQLQVSP
jgi:hypothetical protein